MLLCKYPAVEWILHKSLGRLYHFGEGVLRWGAVLGPGIEPIMLHIACGVQHCDGIPPVVPVVGHHVWYFFMQSCHMPKTVLEPSGAVVPSDDLLLQLYCILTCILGSRLMFLHANRLVGQLLFVAGKPIRFEGKY